MTSYKCSLKTLKQYEKEIKKYLSSKGIQDFSRYDISISDNKLQFKKWDYEGISIPSDITIPTIDHFTSKEDHWFYELDFPKSEKGSDWVRFLCKDIHVDNVDNLHFQYSARNVNCIVNLYSKYVTPDGLQLNFLTVSFFPFKACPSR
jgi:hypothetical protein